MTGIIFLWWVGGRLLFFGLFIDNAKTGKIFSTNNLQFPVEWSKIIFHEIIFWWCEKKKRLFSCTEKRWLWKRTKRMLVVALLGAALASSAPLYRACVLNGRGSVTGPIGPFGPGVGYLTLNEGLNAIEIAANRKCDFILLPELGFEQTFQKNIAEIVIVGELPNGPYKIFQQTMSAAAIENNINVIMNFVEQGELCARDAYGNYDADCALQDQDGLVHHTHNTIVVFNPSGVVQAKYRKLKPMTGFEFYRPGTDVVTTTIQMPKSGGSVLFGLDICFDMLHNTPLPELVQAGVKHLLHPTQWDNLRAGYADLPIFQGISEKYGLTVIASDTTLWASGSAVFQNGKILSAFSGDQNVILSVDVFDETHEASVVKRVSTDGTTWKFPLSVMNQFVFPSAESLSMAFPVTTEKAMTVSLSSADGVVCSVTGKLKEDAGDKYIVYLRRGTPVVDLNLEDCGIQVCNTPMCTIDTAYDVAAKSVFNQLEIKMIYPKAVFAKAQGFLASSRMTNNLMCPFQGGYEFKQFEDERSVVGLLEYKRRGGDNDPLVNAQVYGSFAI
jgi:predicted amidohydrolase